LLQRRFGDARVDVSQLALEDEWVVVARLHVHQQAVESCDVDTRRVEPALERLHERRARADERVENVLTWTEVPREQDLDELLDELPQVRMETVDVLRPVALGEVALRPRELEIDVRVEGVLRWSHASCSSP